MQSIPALVRLGLNQIRTVEKPTACVNCDEFKKQKCACGGPHPLKIVGEGVGPIQSYTGKLPSPFPIASRRESWKGEIITDSKVRAWAKEAAAYHEVPYEMVAVILQQENAPNAATWRKAAQFVERTGTNVAARIEEKTEVLAKIDEYTGALSKIKEKTDFNVKDIPNGSTGIMNMRRPTLLKTISYTKEKYGRPIVPSDKSNIDSGFAGDDWEADLYYLAAHVRQLIDERVMGKGKSCAKGEITLEQVWEVFADYNGPDRTISGPYADDAMAKLYGAYNGKVVLYFYEK